MPLTARQEEMIRNAKPMDDLTIRLMLRENPELAELLCRIILARENLHVVETAHTVRCFQRGHSKRNHARRSHQGRRRQCGELRDSDRCKRPGSKARKVSFICDGRGAP